LVELHQEKHQRTLPKEKRASLVCK
jgi:hypothetical protein